MTRKVFLQVLYGIVKKEIDEWDAYALLAGGSPDDEFDAESRKIANKLTNDSTMQDIAYIISNIFTASFDDPENFKAEMCLDVAQKIKKSMDEQFLPFT